MQKSLIQPILPTTDGIPDALARTDFHNIVLIDDCWFSYTRKGDSIQFHVFTNKPKQLSACCELLINWLFYTYPWCKMLIVTLNKRSLEKLALKHNFEVVSRNGDCVFLARKRSWDL